MAKNIKKIAAGLGAQIVAQVPDTGAGAFGAARLARIVETIQARLVPGQGLRPGRPTDASWVRHPKVPMSGRHLASDLTSWPSGSAPMAARSARCRLPPRSSRTP